MNEIDVLMAFVSVSCLAIALVPLILVFMLRSRSKKKAAIENPSKRIPTMEVVWSYVSKNWQPNRQMVFWARYKEQAKNPKTAQALAVFLGGVGAHWLYVGNVGRAVLYFLFMWTLIPALLGLLESESIQEVVKEHNGRLAFKIANEMVRA